MKERTKDKMWIWGVLLLLLVWASISFAFDFEDNGVYNPVNATKFKDVVDIPCAEKDLDLHKEGNKIILDCIEVPSNPHVKSIWDCEEGCLYSDWIQHGYSNRTEPSKMYNTCASICRTGFVKTPTQDWRE